jgi:hypothetical protein
MQGLESHSLTSLSQLSFAVHTLHVTRQKFESFFPDLPKAAMSVLHLTALCPFKYFEHVWNGSLLEMSITVDTSLQSNANPAGHTHV